MMQYSAMMARMRGIPQPLSMFVLLPSGSQLSQFTPAIVAVEEMDLTTAQMAMMGIQNLIPGCGVGAGAILTGAIRIQLHADAAGSVANRTGPGKRVRRSRDASF